MKFKIHDIERELKKQEEVQEVSTQELNDQIMKTIEALSKKGIVEKNPKIFNSMVKYLAETYLEEKNIGKRQKGILYFGEIGTGKSFAVKVIAAFRGIHFYTCDELFRIYQANKESFWHIIDEKKDLILDDLGAEATMHDYGMRFELFANAITARHRLFESRGIRTLITTNLSGQAIKERYSERIYSRLRHMCDCICATGEDLRL